MRIAVDVDEVLGRFLYTLNTFCREQHGLNFDVSDYHVYDFATVWKCSQDESNHIVHEFFKSHHFAKGIPPIPGALDSLQRLGANYDLVVVTSRQHVIEGPTLRWVEQNFPSVFEEVHFGNHYALEGQSRKKSEICRDIGAQVLIDDNPRYALECAAEGMTVLLYDWQDGYPWSKTDCGPTHPNIVRVHDWDEVEAALASVFAAQASSQSGQL